MSGKQARWARLTVIEALDFRHRLGYPADSHRIDPRSFERLRGGEPSVGVELSLRPSASASNPSPGTVPSPPLNRYEQAA